MVWRAGTDTVGDGDESGDVAIHANQHHGLALRLQFAHALRDAIRKRDALLIEQRGSSNQHGSAINHRLDAATGDGVEIAC
jgi:hypothetical protein